MKYTSSSQSFFSLAADVLILPVFEGEKEAILTQEISSLDKKLLGNITTLAKAQKFLGKKHTVLSVQTHGSLPTATILLLGLGKNEAIRVKDVMMAGAVAIQYAKKLHAVSLAWASPEGIVDVSSVVVGMALGDYSFSKYKKKDNREEKTEVESVTFVFAVPPSGIETEITQAQTIVEAVLFARDLINEPPSVTTPTYLADVAKSIAKSNKDISATILSVPEMKKLGMGAVLSIAQGSREEPKFIHLTYNGGDKKVITLVGKGITFDTGGLSLKSPGSMESMKMDMAGAAVILAIFSILQILQLDITVHGLIPATENMPGEGAIKPGDIVTAMNGKTIEILNTDAEGRVVLADAMSYAAKIQSDIIIDFATLTGACVVALGEEVAGLFSNTPDLSQQLLKNAHTTGEQLWELPLVEEYREQLKSSVADSKNIGSKYGGAITGALFIESFVPEKTSWAHIDIAGPAFAEKNTTLCTRGGTGFGIRMIIEYLRTLE